MSHLHAQRAHSRQGVHVCSVDMDRLHTQRAQCRQGVHVCSVDMGRLHTQRTQCRQGVHARRLTNPGLVHMCELENHTHVRAWSRAHSHIHAHVRSADAFKDMHTQTSASACEVPEAHVHAHAAGNGAPPKLLYWLLAHGYAVCRHLVSSRVHKHTPMGVQALSHERAGISLPHGRAGTLS